MSTMGCCPSFVPPRNRPNTKIWVKIIYLAGKGNTGREVGK